MVDNPLKLDKLNEIYDRPAYDVRYYVKCIPGNLNVNGSTLSKANHSCTAARFGDSGAWISIFHLHDLIERQQYLVNKDTIILTIGLSVNKTMNLILLVIYVHMTSR